MKGKISSKQICGMAAFVAVLAVVLVYVLIFKDYRTKTEALKQSNAALDERVEKLKIYFLEETANKDKKDKLEKEIDELLAPYPADILDEDIVAQSIMTQRLSPLVYTSINVDEKEVLSVIEADVVKAAGIEKYQEPIVFTEKRASYVNEVTYTGLKDAIEAIKLGETYAPFHNYLIGIECVNYSKGEEDKLNGTLDLVFYSVSGTDKEYVELQLPQYLPGTTNIFGEAKEED